MVSNNFILCKEAGWKNYQALCRWNEHHPSEKGLSDFNIHTETLLTKGEGQGRVLSLRGAIPQSILNQEEIDYQIKFDLVNWKDSSIQSLIGDIPQSICRDTQTMKVRTDLFCHSPGTQTQCCNSQEKSECGRSSGRLRSNTFCEYISDMDQDHTIVLISVQAPFREEGSNQNIVHAGVRRPVAMPLIQIAEEPICQLVCATSDTGVPFPECRGEFSPKVREDSSTVEIRVENPGPGAIYALSLLRQDTMLRDDSSPPKYSVTEDLLEQKQEEVLLPGEDVTFEDSVDCEDSREYVYSFQYARGSRGVSVYKDVNVHAQPYMSSSYGLFSLQTPTGACMAPDDDGIMKSIKGNCPNEYTPGKPCGSNGHCRYSHIEPRRSMQFKTTNIVTQQRTEKITTTIIRYIPPH